MKRSCKECGKQFVTYPSRVKDGRGVYCSKQCCLKNTSLTGTEGFKTRFTKGHKKSIINGTTIQVSRVSGKPYRLVYSPDHPFRSKRKYVREHRLVMERVLGRYLLPTEIVHHIDGNTLNNTPENLQVMAKREHDRLNTPLNIHKRWENRRQGGVTISPPLIAQ